MNEFMEIPLNRIAVADNYRKTLNDKALKELAASIKQHGVQEPVIVRQNGGGKYRIVAGQRRFKAAEIAGLVTIPAIVRDIAEEDVLTIQIIENVQRENVPFMEEADALCRLRDEQALDAAEIAKLIGKSEVYVNYMLRLGQMEPDAQQICRDGKIAKTTAWLIARLDRALQVKAAEDLAREKGAHIHEKQARRYIQTVFGEKTVRTRRTPVARRSPSAAWKDHLVNFSSEQFEQWKSIVRGRTEIGIWCEAVEVVALGDV